MSLVSDPCLVVYKQVRNNDFDTVCKLVHVKRSSSPIGVPLKGVELNRQ